MLRVLLASTAALVWLAAPVFAVPADQAGADRIEQGFKTFGAPEGLVTVTPRGDVYELALDAAPLFALAKDTGATGSLNRLVMTLTDNGDGTWGVIWAQDLAFDLQIPGEFEMQFKQLGNQFTGTFDETLMTFSQATATSVSGSLQQTEQDPMLGETTTDATFGAQTSTFQASANPAGGVDNSVHTDIAAMRQTMNMGMSGDTPMPPITVDIAAITQDGSIKGIRNLELMQLLAWAIPNWQTDPALLQSGEAKAQLAAVLPVFDSFEGSFGVTGMIVQTPMGEVGLDAGMFEVSANGLVKDGLAREAISLAGLHLPPSILPDWIAAVMPQTAGVDMQVTGFDAAAWADVALTWFDLPSGMADLTDWQDRMLAALLPDGAVTVTLNPGATSGKDYKLTYEGSLLAGPQTEIPTGTGKVTLTGIEALIEAMKAAPEDMRMPAMMGLGAMRGIAKPGPDGGLVWEIDGSIPGTLLVNGNDVMGLLQ